MRYAYYDKHGKLISIGESSVKPADAIGITQEEYDRIVAEYSKTIEPDPVAAARKRIDDAYQGELDAAASGYPSWERDSWLRQESEARSVLMSRPWINAAAEESGIDTGDLIDKIKEKADAFNLLHARATGKRHRLIAELEALGESPTTEQLNAIQW